MKITLDQPTFLTALTADNTNPATSETDTNFLNFLTDLLSGELPAGDELQTTPQSAIEQASTTPDAAQMVSDESSATLDNLLIGMNYLAQFTPPTSMIKNEKPLEPTSEIDADFSATTGNQGTTESTATQGSIPIMPSTTKATSLASVPDAPVEKGLSAFESNKLNSMNKALRPDRDASVRQEGTAFLSSLTSFTKPTQEHEQKATQMLNQLAEWVQGKINADPTLAVLPLPSTQRAMTERALTSLSTENTAINGAATPANAAWEAKVEVQQTVSNAEINLAHYQANIKIYPPELGKVSAKLKMDKNSATLTVTAETKEVKALIETNLAGLREQFANSNIQLDRIEVTLADGKGNANTDANARREAKQEKQALTFEASEPHRQKPAQAKQKQSDNAVDAYV